MTSNNKKTAFLILAVFLLSLDRFLKSLALFGFKKPIVANYLNFEFVPNYYIAFSLPLSGFLLSLLIILIILGLIILFIANIKEKSTLFLYLLGIVILGASSNLYDRLVYGYVIDYINLAYFSVFNVADVMISLGVFSLILYSSRLDLTKSQ